MESVTVRRKDEQFKARAGKEFLAELDKALQSGVDEQWTEVHCSCKRCKTQP